MTKPIEIKDIPGLVKRHVEGIDIRCADSPPRDIRDARSNDIMLALALGFQQIASINVYEEAYKLEKRQRGTCCGFRRRQQSLSS